MEKKLKEFIQLIDKKTSLKQVCSELEISEFEALGLANIAQNYGYNIISQQFEDGIYMVNNGETDGIEDKTYHFNTDESQELKIVVISDTRFGSKDQQLSILNDIYQKASEMGYDTVIHCGNITNGLYSLTDPYQDTNFIFDSTGQANYIIANYPKVEGITTYFITGPKDAKHLRQNKINIGKRIADKRKDMIYLGDTSATVNIDKAKMMILNSKLAKTYTASYRPQQYVDAFRSEDKPDILLIGGLLQMDHLSYRDVEVLSIPSLCATTKEMSDKRYANTVGAYFLTIKTDEKGKPSKDNFVEVLSVPYYTTDKLDYLRGKKTVYVNKSNNNNNSEIDRTVIDKFYRWMKNDMPVDSFKSKFNLNDTEFKGIMEACRIYGKNIKLDVDENNNLILKKGLPKKIICKPGIDADNLDYEQILVVSDTHFGNIHQQLHILNDLYEEAYNRGITSVLHVGDLVDGDYDSHRKESPRQQFLHGFDEQAGYVADMYPLVDDITTYYILGSHDETHYKNGKATINKWVSGMRPDIIYLGQDSGNIQFNKTKFLLDHPGGGSAKGFSYKLQQRIEALESGNKPNVLLVGHYHKSYYMLYRNVHGILVPSLCADTQFQHKQGLINYVGGYFLDIYSDKKKGNIEYLGVEEKLYTGKDLWDEAGKDKSKVKKLVIH